MSNIRSGKNYNIDMCTGSLPKKMLLFALPLIFSSVLQLLFNAADLIVVGRCVGDEALAAVGSTGALINLLTNLFIGLSVGANVLVARYTGAGRDKDVEEMRDAYNQRRRYLINTFKQMGLPCFEPFGAFYIFPCIKEFGLSSDEFATRLLMEEKVAVVPGTAFGDSGEGFLRISYAYSMEALKEALGRIEHFVQRLRESK